MAEMPLSLCGEDQAVPHLDYNLRMETGLQKYLNCLATRYNTLKKNVLFHTGLFRIQLDWMELSTHTSLHWK